MGSPLYSCPTAGSQALAALCRYPARTAFAGDGGTLTYRAVHDLIGRMQAVFVTAGLGRGGRVALLTSNRHETWCASVAAQLAGAATTSLHPLGSLADQLDQIEDAEADALVVDTRVFRARGAELAAGAPRLRTVFTLEDADYGRNLLTAAEAAGAVSVRDLADADTVAILNYTGGTDRQIQGRAAPPPRGELLRNRNPRRLRNPPTIRAISPSAR